MTTQEPPQNGFPPFKSLRHAVYCATCRREMEASWWPKHWRSREHRYNLAVGRARAATVEYMKSRG